MILIPFDCGITVVFKAQGGKGNQWVSSSSAWLHFFSTLGEGRSLEPHTCMLNALPLSGSPAFCVCFIAVHEWN